MAHIMAGCRAAVLSDNEWLFKAIRLNLQSHLGIEVVQPAMVEPGDGSGQQLLDGLDLIVVALSSPVGEPLVVLSQASMIDLVGQVPVLIISDRPFRAEPASRIFHLSFPFDVEQLHVQLAKILGSAKIGE